MGAAGHGAAGAGVDAAAFHLLVLLRAPAPPELLDGLVETRF